MDLPTLSNLSLFSGAGGLEQGARATGRIRTVCYVEFDAYAQAVLQSRIRDGRLDDAPIWDDVRTFDGKPWRGVDIISGGFPCQDVSHAGKRAGMGAGTRSGLWGEFHRIIREAQPRFVLVENVFGLLSIDAGRGFGTVLGDLATAGYDAEWFVLSAADVGAPHLRERVWICAYTEREGWERPGQAGIRRMEMPSGRTQLAGMGLSKVWEGSSPEPAIFGMAHGLAHKTHRLRCLGNGVVPQQSLPAWWKIIERAGP